MEIVPLEIWGLIAGKTYSTGDNQTLKAMCLASRDMHSVVTPWLYRHIVLDGNKSLQLHDLTKNIVTKDRGKYVHRVEIPDCDAVLGGTLTHVIAHLLPTLPVLQRFMWRARFQIPERLLELLLRAQSVSQLDILYKVTIGPGQQLITSSSLENTKLKRLELDVDWPRSGGGNPNMPQCKTLIITAPNLRLLKMTITPRKRIILNTTNPLRVQALIFDTNQQMPPIEMLWLENYNVGLGRDDELEHRLQVSSLRSITLNTGPRSNVAVFLKTLVGRGHPQLKCIVIGASNSFGALPTAEWIPSLVAFLLSFKGLRKLGLVGHVAPDFQDVKSAIHNHRDTLSLLELRGGYPLHIMNAFPKSETDFNELRHISSTCPHLEALSIYLALGAEPLHGYWLVEFPALKNLKIYTPVYGDANTPYECHIEYDYIHALALALKSHSPWLESLTVLVGPHARPAFSELTPAQQWGQFRRAVWNVKYSGLFEKDQGISIEETVYANLFTELRTFAEASGSVVLDPVRAWKTYLEWRESRGVPKARFVSDHLITM